MRPFNIEAYSLSENCGVTTAAGKQQQSNGVFNAVSADDCARNNEKLHATAKQQLHCNRGTVFSTRSMPRYYK
jgi:hypothetical protein